MGALGQALFADKERARREAAALRESLEKLKAICWAPVASAPPQAWLPWLVAPRAL